MFLFSIYNVRFEWNGAHTVNVYNVRDENVDVFSLNYGRDDYTEPEVMAAAWEWMND